MDSWGRVAPLESWKTRHTVICCILFVRDASSGRSRTRTPHRRRGLPAGTRPAGRTSIANRDDLPPSPDPAARDLPRPPDNLGKHGLIALLRGWKLALDGPPILHGPGRLGIGTMHTRATRWQA